MKYPKTRLSLLMFIQFFIWGATSPVISLYLRDCLHFSGAQIGLMLGLAAVSSIVSPLIMTFLADRVISSERLLTLLNAAGGVCMVVFSAQREFYPALAVFVLYYVAMNPTVPLISAITFHHAPTERRKFGSIRVWGTAGWIAVAWFFSFGVLGGGGASADGGSKLPLLLNIAAVSAFVMAAYSLTIPKHGKSLSADKRDGLSGDGGAESAGQLSAGEKGGPSAGAGADSCARPFFQAGAFRVIMRPEVLRLSLLAAAMTFIDKFYSLGTAPFLKQAGFGERAIMPAMSLGQIPELFAMGLLGYLLKRWGARAVFAAGVGIGILRFAACAVGSSKLLIFAGLSVHGLVYTFTMITAVICLDGFCGGRERTGVHQLFGVLTGGVGGFLGNYAAGRAVDLFAGPGGAVNFAAYWSIPLALSVIIFVTILFARPSKHNVF